MAIDVKELRVGNWVLFNEDGKWTEQNVEYVAKDVSGYKGWMVSFGWASCTLEGVAEDLDVKPILLSPEILEKCGFNCTSKGFYTHPKWYNLSLKYRRSTHDLRCNFMETVATNVDYLHNLQNIFFDTVGEELNYTP